MYSRNTEQFSKVPCLVYGFHIVPEEKIRVGRDYQAVVPELIPLSGMYYIMSQFVNGATCWHCHKKGLPTLDVIMYGDAESYGQTLEGW
jgi:hypothetical protein